MANVARLKKMVEQVLEANWSYRGVEARNSDIACTIIIWQKWYNVSTNDDGTVHLYKLFDLPDTGAVKRIRARFNKENKFLPTSWKVAKARKINREDWEAGLGYKLDPEEIKRYHENIKEVPDLTKEEQLDKLGLRLV